MDDMHVLTSINSASIYNVMFSNRSSIKITFDMFFYNKWFLNDAEIVELCSHDSHRLTFEILRFCHLYAYDLDILKFRFPSSIIRMLYGQIMAEIVTSHGHKGLPNGTIKSQFYN